MKRYRIFSFDFDSRAILLDEPNETWEPQIKEQHWANKRAIEDSLRSEFGELNFHDKLSNLKEIGAKPFSLVAYHNNFLTQIRDSYIMGYYYPSLVSACALAERILNHLMLDLRDEYKNTGHKLKIYTQGSFDKWADTANILKGWGVLQGEVFQKFAEFEKLRNESLHFNSITAIDTKNKALQAIKNIGFIIEKQFSAINQPYFFMYPGEIYVKKDFEQNPFVKKFILSNSFNVSPNHRLNENWQIVDDGISEREYSEDLDEIFLKLRAKHLSS